MNIKSVFMLLVTVPLGMGLANTIGGAIAHIQTAGDVFLVCVMITMLAGIVNKLRKILFNFVEE